MSILLQRMSRDSDAVVIERSVQAPEAFAELFDRHWESVYRYCRSRAGDAGEDLAADTFGLAFDRRAGYDLDHTDARPWLLGLATNLIRNHLRASDRGRRALKRLDIEQSEDHADTAMGRAEAALLGPALAQALGGIPEADRDTLLLVAWNDLTYAEVADALGVPLGTVCSRVSRARLRLRVRLNQLGITREAEAQGPGSKPRPEPASGQLSQP
jgi:RNA polymerase sigma factor (sigma-70 family)